jgi:hypothetical protein
MVGGPEAVHFDGLSAFRRCGRNMVHCFNNTGGRFSSRWTTSELPVIRWESRAQTELSRAIQKEQRRLRNERTFLANRRVDQNWISARNEAQTEEAMTC